MGSWSARNYYISSVYVELKFWICYGKAADFFHCIAESAAFPV